VKTPKIWVFDSSPLIYLNKVGLEWVLEELEGDKIVPPEVYEQVVTRGKARGDADALLTEQLVEQGVITVVPVESDFKARLSGLRTELHEGELDVLALADEKSGTAVLDESIAREVATVFKIEVHGTLFLLFLMVRGGKMKKEEARDKVNLMIHKGFRLGHEEYLAFLQLLQKL
jgi:predicted nucleic acid-binding protein